MYLRKLGVALVAALAVGALMATGASAAPSTGVTQWSVNGAPLSGSAETKCSKASEKITLKATVAGVAVSLKATGVECVGSKIENTTVEGASMAVDAGKLKLTGVTMEPSMCKTAESITTESLATNLEMDGESVYDKFAPVSGTKVATIKVEGCALAGSYSMTGFVRGLAASQTLEEGTSQVLKFNSTSNAFSELKLAGNTATLEGEIKNELVSGGTFGAFEAAETQKISFKPIRNQNGVACPETAGKRVKFVAVGDSCEYRLENENAKEKVEVTKIELIVPTECQAFTGNCLKLVTPANPVCEEPGLILGGTVLAAAGVCSLKLETKWRVAIPPQLSSLEVKTVSKPGAAKVNSIAGQSPRMTIGA